MLLNIKHTRRQARTWKRSGLITEDQLRAIYADTDPHLQQTHLFFRILFFIFTHLCAGALFGLLVWMTGIRSDIAVAATLIFFGAVYYSAAESLVRKRQFYRYGIEEGLALIAMGLFCLGCGWLLYESIRNMTHTLIAVSSLLAMTAFWVYLRFGYVYAAPISIAALCTIPFHPKSFPPYIYWPSYVLTFVIPALGLYWGIKNRKRLIMNASIVLSCLTLATNKSYLGWTRYAWDPAILGLVLIALSILLTRWLASGPNQAREGFTAEPVLKPEDHGISLADAAAALTPGAIDAQQPQTPQDRFYEGGASGGGGAARKF